jgi:hypothetical protein
VAQPFGFRTIEMKNGQLLVNGVAITIKGVNRQEHNAVHGRTLSIGEMVKDVKMMKQFNINAVRTSHYPNYSECLITRLPPQAIGLPGVRLTGAKCKPVRVWRANRCCV